VKSIGFGVGVLNQTPLDWKGNQKRISEAILRARDDGVSLLCLPEMCIPGYGCEDAYLAPWVQEYSLARLMALLPETRGMVVSFGLPLVFNNAVFNVAALAVDGKLVGFVPKRFLAGDGLHYEPRWFKGWPASVCATVDIDGVPVPIGDLHFDCGGVRIGFEICEDAWVALRPGGAQALKGVDVILNPSASHFAFGKLKIRERFVLEGSRAFSVTYLYSNLLGNAAGRAIYDGGALIASGGRMLARGPRLSFKDVLVTSAFADLGLTRMQQMRTASFRPELDGDERDRIKVPFEWPDIGAEMRRKPRDRRPPKWERSRHLKNEEFTRAIGLALFDYLRKSRS